MEAQVALLRSEFEVEESEALKVIGIEKARHERFIQDQAKMAKSRKSDIEIKTKRANKNSKNIKDSELIKDS